MADFWTLLRGAAKPIVTVANWFNSRFLYSEQNRRLLDAKAQKELAEAAKTLAEAGKISKDAEANAAKTLAEADKINAEAEKLRTYARIAEAQAFDAALLAVARGRIEVLEALRDVVALLVENGATKAEIQGLLDHKIPKLLEMADHVRTVKLLSENRTIASIRAILDKGED
jgi:hypothetical protein